MLGEKRCFALMSQNWKFLDEAEGNVFPNECLQAPVKHGGGLLRAQKH